MSAFRRAVESQRKGARKPARIIELQPHEFADDWEGRPTSPVLFGLRVPSEGDVMTGRAEAVKRAVELHPDSPEQVDAFNDALLEALVARGICDPNDVTAPHPLLELAEDMVPMALKPLTLRRIFDEIEKLQIEQSPLFPEATDDEVGELVGLLAMQAPLTQLDRSRQLRARRFLKFVLDELETTRPTG